MTHGMSRVGLGLEKEGVVCLPWAAVQDTLMVRPGLATGKLTLTVAGPTAKIKKRKLELDSD